MELELELAPVETPKDITTWSDDKRKEFTDLFKNRAETARYILVATVEEILNRCASRKILSVRHLTKIASEYGGYQTGTVIHLVGHHNSSLRTGGRPSEELWQIAKERAEKTLESLPPLAKALEILDAETLRKMKRRDQLLLDGEKLVDQLEETADTISLSEHKDKTVIQFLQLVAEHNKHRMVLAKKLNVLGAEGSKLEEDINKALYKGVPGLSDAVMDVVRAMLQQQTAMGEMMRRVEERIRFGDSEQAVELLKHFENDEVTVDVEIRERLSAALDKLKVAKPKAKAKKAIT